MHDQSTMGYYASRDARIVDLPYASGKWGLRVILPRKGVSVAALAQRLSPGVWRSWTSHLRSTEVTLALPRIQARSELGLRSQLTALGMGQAFSRTADFSGMCKKSCRVSDVRHATFFKVNESGTEASAATSISVVPTLARTSQVSVTVNRPFLVAITERKTGAVVFLGSINNPA